MYDTSPGAPSSKRRRSDGADDDEEMIDYNEQSSSDSDDGEPDEEEVRAQVRKRAPAQKKARANGTTTLPIRQAGKKKGSKKTLNGIDADAAGGMFAELFAQHVDPQEVVSQWLVRFESSQSGAVAELVNFVLRSAGCTSSVSEEHIENPDGITTAIVDLQDEFQASNPTDYPLMQAKGRTATTIKHGVAEFLDTLLKSIAANGMLFDNPEIMENIHEWLSTMSSAANRPFRHTATVVSLICITSLCEIASSLASDAAKSQRQAETEGKKTSKNKARISEITKKADEANQRVQAVEAIVRDWFDTVFIHRYKDIDAAIRRECAASLGDWVCTLPNVFFDGEHLRYLGWLFSDTNYTVRLEAVKQTHRFYRNPTMISALKGFTDKFKQRLVEIATSDAESVVRTAAIDLLNVLRDNGILEPEEVDAVGRLVFETDDKVRKAAARFLAPGINELYDVKLNTLGGLAALEEILTAPEDNYTAPRIEWLKLKCVVEALEAYSTGSAAPQGTHRARLAGELSVIAAGTESRFALAAADLLSGIAEMRDPQIIAGFLLADEPPAKNRRKTNDLPARFRTDCLLSPREEIVMLDLLHVSTREAISSITDKLKTSTSKKLLTDQQEELEEIVRHVLTSTPLLLEQLGNSAEAVTAILRSVKVIRMPAVEDLGIEATAYTALLEQAKQQFTSHNTDDVLSLAVQIVAQAKMQSELEETANDILTDLWETSVVGLINTLDLSKIKQRGTVSEASLRATINSLRHVVQLSQVSNPISVLEDKAVLRQVKNKGEHTAAIDCIISLVEHASPGRTLSETANTLEDELSQRAAEIALFYFRWCFVVIKQRVSGPNATNLSFEELEALATRRDRFADILTTVLQQRKAKDELCVIFAGLQIDLHSSSNALESIDRASGISDDYTVFLMDMHKTKQKSILRAFAGAEAVFASLSGKKLDAASTNTQDDEPAADDVDEDPESEDEDEDDAATEVSALQREQKLQASILAESRLCQLTSKIVLAVLANLMDKKTTRRRVERNKQKLGHNFKEVCKFFDLDPKTGLKLKARAAKKAGAAKAGAKANVARGRKANAIDAESEQEDEIEDVDEVDQANDRQSVDEVDDEMEV